MIILGVDPGVGTTGWAVLGGDPESPILLEYGAIRTRPVDEMPLRLELIFTALRKVLEQHHPDEMAIEDVFLAKDTRAALALGQARGAALLAAAVSGVAVRSYSALEVKQSVTGHGRASKDQVAFMVQRLTQIESLPQPQDCTDAAGIALCHLLRSSSSALSALGAAR